MSSDLANRRQELRQEGLARRDSLPPAERSRRSELITRALITHPVFSNCTTCCLYCSFRSEVMTGPLLHHCLEVGKKIGVPLTLPAVSRLRMVRITDPERDLEPGYLGIAEPRRELVEQAELTPASIDLVILPGALFDRSGQRLGYGGGFYDRFLALEAPGAVRVGRGFACQLVERLPALPHDMPLDLLCTENEILAWRRER